MCDAARYIRNDLKNSVESSMREAESIANNLSSNNIRNRSDADDAKNDIMDSLRGMRRSMNDSFDRAETRVIHTMPNLNREQQRDLREAVEEVGGFVNKFTRLIENVCDKVVDFFLRSLDRIKEFLVDLKNTVRGCCKSIRDFFRGW